MNLNIIGWIKINADVWKAITWIFQFVCLVLNIARLVKNSPEFVLIVMPL